MALHFTSETPDDQYFGDFGNLNKLQIEVSFKLDIPTV